VRHGKEIRHSKKYVKAGINVNYIQSINGVLHVRTYERGVEAETLSCGTGVTAAAIVHVLASELLGESNVVNIETLGGKFQVYFSFNGEFFYDIHLQAPATFVYNGEVEL
jgi:diaminopimelate epimerase